MDLFRKPTRLNVEKRRAILAQFATNELHWVISRYCGPNNSILSEKKFGFILNTDDVIEEHLERSLFGDQPE